VKENIKKKFQDEKLPLVDKIKKLDNQNEISSNIKEVGLITYVNKGDYMDAIWIVEGKKISRHAAWTDFF